MGKSWNDFKKIFPWKAMTVGFLIPKALLFAGISLDMLAPGAALAAAWCLAVFAAAHFRKRSVNIFAIFALAMIFLRVVVILASKSPALYLIAQAVDSALYAIVFFISLLFPRSIIQLFAESSGVVMPEAIRGSPYYGKAWRIITAVWASAFMILAAALAIIKMTSMKLAAVVDMLSSWPLTAALIAFTVIFPRLYWKKKIIITCILCIMFVIPAPARCEEILRRGLFVSVIQDPPVLSNRQDISKLVAFAVKARVNTLFVQIYFANKAWFPSKAADSGPYRACLKKLSEDPLALLIKEAHSAGIEVHAWMNMLSLGANKDARFLKKYGTDILTRNLKDKRTLEDYKIDDQFFLEPGDLRVGKELSGLLGEVLRAYPGLDGVQFDYVRYPDKEPAYGYTQMNVGRFKKATGNKVIDELSQDWKDWKRDQVTGLLELLVKRARALRPKIKVSATGCMPYSRAYLEAFQDWPSWIERGLVDYVTIMSYSPYPVEFERTILKAKAKTGDFTKVNIAIGAYKLVRAPGAFEKEFLFSEKSGAGGFAIFHYGNLLENPALGRYLIGDRK